MVRALMGLWCGAVLAVPCMRASAQSPPDPEQVYADVTRQVEEYRAEADRRLATQTPDDAVDQLADEAAADPSVAFDRWAVIGLIESRRDLWVGQQAALGKALCVAREGGRRDPVHEIAAGRVWADAYADALDGYFQGLGADREGSEMRPVLEAYVAHLLTLDDTPTAARAADLAFVAIFSPLLSRPERQAGALERLRAVSAQVTDVGLAGVWRLVYAGQGAEALTWATEATEHGSGDAEGRAVLLQTVANLRAVLGQDAGRAYAEAVEAARAVGDGSRLLAEVLTEQGMFVGDWEQRATSFSEAARILRARYDAEVAAGRSGAAAGLELAYVDSTAATTLPALNRTYHYPPGLASATVARASEAWHMWRDHSPTDPRLVACAVSAVGCCRPSWAPPLGRETGHTDAMLDLAKAAEEQERTGRGRGPTLVALQVGIGALYAERHETALALEWMCRSLDTDRLLNGAASDRAGLLTELSCPTDQLASPEDRVAVYERQRQAEAADPSARLSLAACLQFAAGYMCLAGRADEALPLLAQSESIHASEAARAGQSPQRASQYLEFQANGAEGAGHARQALRDVPGAIAEFERALALHEQAVGPNYGALVARVATQLAPLYDSVGRTEDAAAARARARGAAALVEGETQNAVAALAEAGATLTGAGRLQPAGRFLVQGVSLARILERRGEITPTVEADALSGLGGLRRRTGALDAALDLELQALELRQAVAPDSSAVADSLAAVAALRSDRGELDEACTLLEQSLAIAEQPKSGKAPEALAGMRSDLGYLLLRLGERAEARSQLERAVAALGAGEDSPLPAAYARNNLGLLLLEEGDAEGALDRFREAQELLDAASPGSTDLAIVLRNAADAQRRLGFLPAARAKAEAALALLAKQEVASNALAQVQAELGLIARDEGDAQQAVAELRKAVATLDGLRRELGSGTSGLVARAAFLSGHAAVYRDLVGVLVGLGEVDGAAAAAEAGRSRGLLETSAELAARERSGSGLSEGQAEVDIQRDLLNAELFGIGRQPADPTRAKVIRAQLATLELRQVELDRARESSDVSRAALSRPQPMTPDEIRARLDPGTLALTWVTADEVCYLFAMDRETAPTVYTLPCSRVLLEDRAAALLAAVASGGEVEALAGELGELLLGPVSARIGQARRLLLLPDGPLWQVPFQALACGGAPLAARAPASYAPSGTLFVRLREARAGRATEGSLAVGDPDFSALSQPAADATPEERVRSADVRGVVEGGLRVARLPFTGEEVTAVSDALGSGCDTAVGVSATEGYFRHNAPGRRVVHLATHGVLRARAPLESCVLLSFPRRPTLEDDGMLKARDVYGLDLAGCDLVTLSACETAKGQVLAGEGVLGLPSAFLAAGAATVVCSQWSVADDSTAALMARFYEHYRTSGDKADALALAMNEIRTGQTAEGKPLELPEGLGPWREEWRHPRYWAPFVVIGDSD
jgi:CHAT domain-containing protein/tetratricopeptide (TPR) repeat protein